MTNRLLVYECAPLISMLYARSAITTDEKKMILDSIRNDPEVKDAISIMAQKLLKCPNSPDIRALYEKLKGET